MERRGAFDYILLETTGLADPGNLAPLFWVDEGLGSTIYLDGIVTLVDAKNIMTSLDERVPAHTEEQPDSSMSALGEVTRPSKGSHTGPELSTAHLQISHADVIVLNKSDLVEPQRLREIEQRIRSINALAKIHVTAHSRVPQLEGVLLDLHAYDQVDAASLDFAAKGHSHMDPAIGTISLVVPVLDESRLIKLDSWLRSLLWEGLFLSHPDASGETPHVGDSVSTDRTDIHRIKGRLPMTDGRLKLLQGVREVFEFLDSGVLGATNQGNAINLDNGKIVVIGRNISGKAEHARMQKSLDDALK